MSAVSNRVILAYAAGWFLGAVASVILTIVISAVFLIPVIVISHFVLGISSKILFFAVVGYSLINFRKMLKMSQNEVKETQEFIIKHPEVLLALFLAIYLDFSLAVAVSTLLLSVGSGVVLLPMVWFFVERWLIDNQRWYLTPTGLTVWAIAKIVRMDRSKIPTYLPIPSVGKLQRMLM